ncbi:TonB-dependent receptor [soil metagenome]
MCLVVCSYVTNAQSVISGKVTDVSSGLPLEGVSVKIKSSNVVTITNKQGDFSIKAAAADAIIFSYIGYEDQEITVASQTSINVQLVSAITDLGQLVLVGTRTGGRIKTESPVPVDIININQAGAPTARMDLSSVLNYAAPSFNYNKQSGADGADHIDLGTLRGLGPDQTLVLINGKRRHQTAFVALFGTRGRGNSGTDMNSFPEAAVDRIEILRDGASAQYGSDAMAGVINIILRKDVNKWTINTGWAGYWDKYNSLNSYDPSQYYTGNKIDGQTVSISANNGWAIGKNGGFINLSLDYLNQGKTFRQTLDTNVATNPDALPTNTGRRAYGDGSVWTAGGMYNMEIPTTASKKTTFYSFGGYNYKAADVYAYTRNYSGRPDRFPIDANGDLLFVPSIMHTSKDGETFYNPHIQAHITDMSLAAGLRGDAGNNWNWDLSNTIGRNDFHYYGDKTFNTSLVGETTPNHFDDGGFNFLQNTLNLDFSKAFKGIGEGVNLALGAEFRYERYSIYEGDEASYKGYTNEFDQAPGAQGFPGFSPDDVVKADRTNISAYADAEINVTTAWLVDLAVRFENYSDFGYVNTSKIATRYKLTHNFNLRGSISTGFRAPSLQQINFSNTLTSFSNGALVQSRISSNSDPVTKAAGIPDLKEETSINSSVGFSWKPAKGLTFTLDGYMIKVKDRIVLSGLFFADDATLPTDFTDALNNLNVATAQFFDNAVNTTNYGLDIVIDYTKKWGNHSFKALLAGNLQHMKVDEIHVPAKLDDSYLHRKSFFSDREEAFLLASAPKSKFALGLEYSIGKFSIGTHFTYFGKVRLMGYGWTGDYAGSGINPLVPSDKNPDVNLPEEFIYHGKITTDVYASFKFSKHITVFAGVDNLLNVHPDLGVNPAARYSPFDNESGGPWDSVQMGFNGLRMFGKLAFTF